MVVRVRNFRNLILFSPLEHSEKGSALQSRNSAEMGCSKRVKLSGVYLLSGVCLLSCDYFTFTASILSRASFARTRTSSGTVTTCCIFSREARTFSRLTIFILGQQANSEMQ